MMTSKDYLMENDEESKRLDIKTDNNAVVYQAQWAGLAPGMRVVDVGCGPGKTTSALNGLVQPGGGALGIELSEKRVAFAQAHYHSDTVDFVQRDAFQPLTDLGQFDFAWVRFLLEYYRSNSFQLVRNITTILKPGGTLCLIDLDHNCLSHYGHSPRMERAVNAIVKQVEEKQNFDPYVGRKLYSYLYDLGYEDIEVRVEAHHQIFGELKYSDDFNWTKKVEVASRHYRFEEYEGGYEEFLQEFREFFASPRRFTYTPIIFARGRKPLAA